MNSPRAASQRVSFLILLLLLFRFFSAAQERCEVLFLADFLYANNPAWVSKIMTWGATGVNLRVFRSEVESSYHNYDFRFFRGCLRTLASRGLRIHIRVSMALIRPEWMERYTMDDFHQTREGRLVDNYNAGAPGMPVLNLTSEKSRGDLLRFVSAVVNELRRQPAWIRRQIDVVTPTLSPDDETEYPAAIHRAGPLAKEGWWGWMTGYSLPEQEAFIRFLRIRYNGSPDDRNPAGINRAWDASFPVLDREAINIDTYDWDRLRDRYRSYPKGRSDFLEFRAAELKRFLDSCATLVHVAGFEFGIQFAALHDAGVEFRGVWDIAPLVERADLVVGDDIPEHGTSFWFAADYLRTVCRFWTAVRAQQGLHPTRMRFGTETNWPGYNNILPEDLVAGWRRQLDDWYDRGGSVLYLSHWGTVDEVITWQGSGRSQGERRVADVLLKGGLDSPPPGSPEYPYGLWRSALRDFARRSPETVNPSALVHIDRLGDLSGLSGRRERATPRGRGFLRGIDGKETSRVPVREFPFITELGERLRGNGALSSDPVDVYTPFMKSKIQPDSVRYRWIVR